MNGTSASDRGPAPATRGLWARGWELLNTWAARHPYLTAIVVTALWTAVLVPWREVQDQNQWGLWYVLAVVAAASLGGDRSAIASALLAFAAWNYFFIPPYYTFRIQQPTLWSDLTLFLLVGTVVGLQTALRRRREFEALAREREARLLNGLLSELAAPPPTTDVPGVVLGRVTEAMPVTECALYLARPEGGFNRSWQPQPAAWPSEVEARVAETFTSLRPLGVSEPLEGLTAAGEPASVMFLPLAGPESVFGVLYVALRPADSGPSAVRLAQAIASGLTAHLEHDRLRCRAEDLEALEEIDNLKSAFVNSVSHELKTPLASAMATVTGLLEPSEGRRTESENREELEAVVEDLRRLETNIADLLDMSRLENAAWQMKSDSYEIGEIIGSVLAGMPQRHRSRVALSVAESLPPVSCDFRQIARALNNLIDNALAYSPDDERIQVGARVLGNAIVTWVEDRGLGIPLGEREAVFQKFYRSPSVPRVSTSTGLGLPITKEIVTRHGGTIWIEDVEPTGSRFVFTLPLR